MSYLEDEPRSGAMKKVVEITVVIIILMVLLLGMQVIGCRTVPTLTESQPQDRPLTVIPHPEHGFKIVIVPVGTWVGGYKTVEPGLYLTADVVIEMMERRDPELRHIGDIPVGDIP